ncbi:hypothetical protein B0H13DRAFT_2661570 [Mycena leptocephala]|nr:hypothetical protein B0H13DRAFT_2661570 [Mycena leptocephala]
MASGIQRLPTEILSEIFFRCGAKQDGCRPRLVATVCSRWRAVALSTSGLWCNIHLYREEMELESLHSLLKLQLERSGQIPLSVVFCEPRDDSSILELLLSVSHRLQSLDLVVLTSNQHNQLRGSTGHFPILKKLTIRDTPSFELGNLTRPHPLLEELTLSWLRCPVPSQFPWTQLTKCTIFRGSNEDVLNVLRSAPCIAELSLYDCYYLNHRDPDRKTITTPAIRSLKISGCGRTFNQDFLGHLMAPKLQELILENLHDNSVATHITSLLTGSSGHINHLSLCSVRVSERELIAILHLTDTLDHLEISWPWDVHSNTLMEALTIVPGNRTRLLPRLRVLSLTGGLSCHNDVLLTMLQSRYPGLDHIKLYYAGRTFFFDRAFDGLRKAGMKIMVLFDGPVDPFAGDSDTEEILG